MPSSISDFPRPPVHGFRGDTPTPPPPTHPRGLSVAISREAGARGNTIAKKVGELVGWQVFDQETLDYLLQDETARDQLMAEVPSSARAWAEAHFTRLQLNQKLAHDSDTAAMIRLLLAVAARGDAVIVGRGAGFLLPTESTVHVRVIAPFERRVAYFAQWLRLSREEAAAEVRARDEHRAAIPRDNSRPQSRRPDRLRRDRERRPARGRRGRAVHRLGDSHETDVRRNPRGR